MIGGAGEKVLSKRQNRSHRRPGRAGAGITQEINSALLAGRVVVWAFAKYQVSASIYRAKSPLVQRAAFDRTNGRRVVC